MLEGTTILQSMDSIRKLNIFLWEIHVKRSIF